MGNLNAEGFAEAVSEGYASLRQAVAANLTSNHFPPLPRDYVEPVVTAILLVNEGHDPYETTVSLPVDIEPRPRIGLSTDDEGHLFVNASHLLDITHSWGFCDDIDGEEI